MFTTGYISHFLGAWLGDCCGCCGQPAKPRQFCQGCQADLLDRAPGCRFCGTPMDYPGAICGRCLQRTQHYDQLVFCHDYAGPLAELIKGFKYHQQLALAPPLGRVLADALSSSDVDLSGRPALVAMPMHTDRYRSRGYNQATLLARQCANALNLEFAQPLAKTLATPPLEGLGRAGRERAVRGAFAASKITGRWILVDDVYTTGASINAASQALRRAGADSIQALCVARTPLTEDSHHSLLNRGFHDIRAAADD